MSQLLKISNWNPINIVEPTRLDADSVIGASSFTVQNNEGFALNDYFTVGVLGAETTELFQVSSVTAATTITPVATPKLAHDRFDPVTKLFGNQIKIYRAANVDGTQPADSAFASIATITIDPDDAFTQYTDSSGSNAYWYKWTYYNSTSLAETNLSDSPSYRGASYGDYCTIDDIRTEAGFRYAPYVTDDMIDAKRQAAQEIVNGKLHGFYTVPFTAPINPLITDITRRLASGLLLVEQYGQTSAQNTANGQAKIDKAMADLDALATKQLVLVDTAGNSTALTGSTGGISSWPDDTTNATQADGTVDTTTMTEGQDAGHAFRRADILGYYNRKY